MPALGTRPQTPPGSGGGGGWCVCLAGLTEQARASVGGGKGPGSRGGFCRALKEPACGDRGAAGGTGLALGEPGLRESSGGWGERRLRLFPVCCRGAGSCRERPRGGDGGGFPGLGVHLLGWREGNRPRGK